LDRGVNATIFRADYDGITFSVKAAVRFARFNNGSGSNPADCSVIKTLNFPQRSIAVDLGTLLS